MLADIEGKALDVAVAELKKGGIDASGVECDVADRAAVQRAGAETLAAFGKVHIVCINAGVGIGGPMELITSGDVMCTSSRLFCRILRRKEKVAIS